MLGLENELERLQHEREAAREQAEQEVLDVRKGREEIETVVETLEQQHRNLKIDKDTKVESQVQSLNARAAHTANTQFTILQVTLTLQVMKC